MFVRLVFKCCTYKRFLNISRIMESKNIRDLSVDLSSMRIGYKRKGDIFQESDLIAKEPITQFKHWFDEACATPGILEANAMCLATCTKDGLPSARYVLLKGYGKDGFKFYTNYSSRKGLELSENPKAALVFYWEPLKRSVRIEGTVTKLSINESDAYFHSRPRDSQIGACSSSQSRVIKSREDLTVRENELKQQYSDDKIIPRPENWGGYKVIPHLIEFWQGQSDRLHDRIRFRWPKENDVADGIMLHQGDDGWVYERLSP